MPPTPTPSVSFVPSNNNIMPGGELSKPAPAPDLTPTLTPHVAPPPEIVSKEEKSGATKKRGSVVKQSLFDHLLFRAEEKCMRNVPPPPCGSKERRDEIRANGLRAFERAVLKDGLKVRLDFDVPMKKPHVLDRKRRKSEANGVILDEEVKRARTRREADRKVSFDSSGLYRNKASFAVANIRAGIENELAKNEGFLEGRTRQARKKKTGRTDSGDEQQETTSRRVLRSDLRKKSDDDEVVFVGTPSRRPGLRSETARKTEDGGDDEVIFVGTPTRRGRRRSSGRKTDDEQTPTRRGRGGESGRKITEQTDTFNTPSRRVLRSDAERKSTDEEMVEVVLIEKPTCGGGTVEAEVDGPSRLRATIVEDSPVRPSRNGKKDDQVKPSVRGNRLHIPREEEIVVDEGSAFDADDDKTSDTSKRTSIASSDITALDIRHITATESNLNRAIKLKGTAMRMLTRSSSASSGLPNGGSSEDKICTPTRKGKEEAAVVDTAEAEFVRPARIRRRSSTDDGGRRSRPRSRRKLEIEGEEEWAGIRASPRLRSTSFAENGGVRRSTRSSPRIRRMAEESAALKEELVREAVVKEKAPKTPGPTPGVKNTTATEFRGAHIICSTSTGVYRCRMCGYEERSVDEMKTHLWNAHGVHAADVVGWEGGGSSGVVVQISDDDQ